MKRIVLSFIALASLVFSANAQCTPDPQFTEPGIYPDSATGLPTAWVGYAYDEVITIVVPSDTVIDVLGTPTSVPFVDITLDNVSGMPPNFTYSCNPSNCVFPGNSTGCVNLYSTVNPVIGDVGVYQLIIDATGTVTVPILGNQSQQSVIDYYYITIADSASVGIETFSDNTLELKMLYPNPVSENARIQFISGENAAVDFTITNVLGKTVVNKTISAKRGVNDILINADDFSNGIYLYSISANGKTSTKRMIIRK